MFFSHADERLQILAGEWKRRQKAAAVKERIQEAVRRGEIDIGRNDACPCGSGLKYKQCCGSR